MTQKKLKADLEQELAEKDALLQRFVDLQEEGQVELLCDDAKRLHRDMRASLEYCGVTDQDILITLRLPAGFTIPSNKDVGCECQATDNLDIVIKGYNHETLDWEWVGTDFG